MARTFGVNYDRERALECEPQYPLRELRIRAGGSLYQVADALGMRHVYVSRVEREQAPFFNRRHWPALAQVLGVEEIEIAHLWYNRRSGELLREREELHREYVQIIRDLR